MGKGGKKGYVDGPALESRFSKPHGIAIDVNGDVFVSDRDAHNIRKLNVSTGNFHTTFIAF